MSKTPAMYEVDKGALRQFTGQDPCAQAVVSRGAWEELQDEYTRLQERVRLRERQRNALAVASEEPSAVEMALQARIDKAIDMLDRMTGLGVYDQIKQAIRILKGDDDE